ncbi:MFS transporter [Pseudonocardia sp.]|uniref:MFS transporter n=1 Tax=Pseudonocardia sp. TaxID=60912 RepID=UPI003D138F9C
MLPELGASFGTTAEAATVTVTAYLLPFAVLMLVSGTLGERWGRRRTVVAGYVVYVLASLACALAPTMPQLLAARGLQGAANAFTTPLVLATLGATVAPQRMGRALGWFGALQAFGQTSAPLVGGLAAELDWRLAFVGTAVVAGGLAVVGLPAEPRDPGSGPPPPARLATALRPRVLRLGLVAAIGWGCLAGLGFLVALRLEADFGAGAGTRGLVLTCLGAVGMLAARFVGGLADRVGPRRCVLTGAGLGALLVVGIGLAPDLLLVGALWALGGVATQLVLVGVNLLVLGGPEGNRGGAMSVVLSVRFLGGSLAPVALTPVYASRPVAGFLLPAVLIVALVPLLLPGPSRPPGTDPTSPRARDRDGGPAPG